MYSSVKDCETSLYFHLMCVLLFSRLANEKDRADWKILYNFTSYYRLQNVSAASLSDLAFSFLKDSGSENFNK